MKADYQIGIIGAGFAGLVAALRLKKSGRDSFVIFEKNSEVGGTWRDNIYPGCACDVASPLYSFAGEPNPHWSQSYASQPEILAYIKQVVQKNGLDSHIQYNTEVVESSFEKETATWVVTDHKGTKTRVHFLILGIGPLNRPNIPRFEGLAHFQGKQFHSSRWDTSYDLTGKRVAVIGTGASAIQIIPSIAPLVSHLTVFQRTAAWVSPRPDRKSSRFLREKLHRFPFMLKLQRELIYWINEGIGMGFTGNEVLNKLMRTLALRTLAKQVKDPHIRKKLTPDYKIGCKRILRSESYYPVFNQKHVTLVTDPIEKFTSDGIMAGNQGYPQDAVIHATGFVAADINVPLKITGLSGTNLVDEWKTGGAQAYLGTTVAGYPNLAFILGPNTGLGHNSVIHMMESQMNYIMQVIEYLEKNGKYSFLDVKGEAQSQYNQRLQQQFAGTVWNSGCKSWYMNEAGRNTTLFPRLTVTFRRLTRTFDPSVYTLVTREHR